MNEISPISSNSTLELSLLNQRSGINEVSSGSKSSTTSSSALIQIGQRLLNRSGRAEIANHNVNMALGSLRTKDAFQQQSSDSLGRLKELSIRAGDGTLSARNRETLNNEAQQILKQMGSDFQSAEFNDHKILQESAEHVAVDSDGNTIVVHSGSLNPEDLGLGDIDLTLSDGVGTAMEAIASAEDIVNSVRTQNGVDQQILERQFESNLEEESIMTDAGDDFINVDIAEAVTKNASASIKSKIGLAMQAQASQLEANTLMVLVKSLG